MSHQSNTFWLCVYCHFAFVLSDIHLPIQTGNPNPGHQHGVYCHGLCVNYLHLNFEFLIILTQARAHTGILGWTNKEMYQLCSLQLHASPLTTTPFHNILSIHHSLSLLLSSSASPSLLPFSPSPSPSVMSFTPLLYDLSL